MNTPRTRADFERNFNLLRRKISDGKLHIPAGFKALDSLSRIRFLPNGRIDFLSVDELARLQANMMANMSDGLFEDQMKPYQEPVGQVGPESDAQSSTVDSDGKSD